MEKAPHVPHGGIAAQHVHVAPHATKGSSHHDCTHKQLLWLQSSMWVAGAGLLSCQLAVALGLQLLHIAIGQAVPHRYGGQIGNNAKNCIGMCLTQLVALRWESA